MIVLLYRFRSIEVSLLGLNDTPFLWERRPATRWDTMSTISPCSAQR